MAVIGLAPICSCAQPPSDFSRAENVAAVLRNGTTPEVVRILNEVKRVGYRGDVLPLIANLWSGKSNDLPKSATEPDIVRIQLADILAQAYRNGFLTSLDSGIHPYARKLIASDDPQLVSSAVQVLAIIDDPTDVPLLERIASKEVRPTFRATVAALAEMCSPQADEALLRLGSSGLQSENKRFLDETRQSIGALRRTAGVCH